MRGCEWRPWRAAAVLILLGAAVLSPARAADNAVTISATLIHASNAPGQQTDARLRGYEDKLRRMFRFQSYKHYGGGSTTAKVPSETRIGMGHGNTLAVKLIAASGNGVETRLDWSGPSGQIQNTTTILTRGGPPILLGGAPQDGGTVLVAVSAR